MTGYGVGPTTTTYIDSGGEVYRMVRYEARRWPEHRAERLITEAEHGETLLGCFNDDFIGNVAETAAHLARTTPEPER